MSITITNQKSAPAFRGTSVWVTLNASDSAQLINMTLGQPCTLSNGKVGHIDFIDSFGHSFKVKPNMPSDSFIGIANLTYLMSGTSITVG